MKAFDSFAWVEYFAGSERGATVRNYVEGEELLYTPSICLTEVKSRYLREGRDPTARLELIMKRSIIIPLDKQIALLAAEIKQRYKLHTIDAIIYASARSKNLTLITGDQHFKDLPNVELI